MNSLDVINMALSEGRTTLTEAEAKNILKGYGIPVVNETIVQNIEDAVSAARTIGFPVVLKALGAKLTHKTEQGLVRLNLRDGDEVYRAAREIELTAASDLEGFLLQPMISGHREFVAGFIRDPQFGPVVMFGLGGVFTEALRDVTFRIAPFDEKEAGRMLEEIRSAGLLGAFRGEAPADREAVIRSLLGLSDLAMEHPEIVEADINPLIIGPNGAVTAVDALLILSGDSSTDVDISLGESPEDPKSFLDSMLTPKSIAVIGAPRSQEDIWTNILGSIIRYGYIGKIYPINPMAEEINGLKAYPSLASLPERADLVIICVSAPRVPDALRDCVSSGHRNVHIFSAGFKETGEPEGIRLHQEIEAIAEKGGLHVMGPNCMGVHNPKMLMSTWEVTDMAPKQSGPVVFVSQSGGHAGDFIVHASRSGIYFNKAVSYGNALTLDCTDFIPYLADDEETKIICLYLEGIKDGRKLLRQVKQINRVKPVILMKGGLTKSGARAVASHTGSMSGGEQIWETFFRQTGAVKVHTLEDMVDVVQAFLHLGAPKGRGVGVICTGGGIGVSAADCFDRFGLELPPLAEETRTALTEFIPAAGNMTRNPIDFGRAFRDPVLLEKVMQIVSSDPSIDSVVLSLHLDWLGKINRGKHALQLARHIGDRKSSITSGKPFAMNLSCYHTDSNIERVFRSIEQEFIKAAVPVYEGFPKVAYTLSQVASYYEYWKK